jgi:hypothetical protein
MSAPIPDRPPATSPSPSAARRRLPLLVLASLMVVAAAVGTGVALASRPSTRPPADADAAPAGQDRPASQANPGEGTRPTAGTRAKDSGPRPVDTAKGAAVQPNGVHHAYIRNVDVANDRLTVDVVQLFLDGDAVKAAIADGKPRNEARHLMLWLRNQNPRLRTLPLAASLRVDLFDSCEESSDRWALLQKLSGNARSGVYFYTLTVHDGAVHAIKERQITPAC